MLRVDDEKFPSRLCGKDDAVIVAASLHLAAIVSQRGGEFVHHRSRLGDDQNLCHGEMLANAERYKAQVHAKSDALAEAVGTAP